MKQRFSFQWLKHAFAVDDPQSGAPTDAEKELVGQLCRAVVRRRLTPAAVAFLEMCRPLNFLGAQALHFLAPLIGFVADAEACTKLAQFLERRGSVDYLLNQLERLEDEMSEPTRRSSQDVASSCQDAATTEGSVICDSSNGPQRRRGAACVNKAVDTTEQREE